MGVLKDRIAIVTGGGNGIGEAIALEFAAEGAKVAVVDIDFEGAQRVFARLEGSGATALAVQADVSNEASVASMVCTVAEHFGGINILVNNAGKAPRYVWHEMSVEQWDHTQAVNLRSCFLCARGVFPYFKRLRVRKDRQHILRHLLAGPSAEPRPLHRLERGSDRFYASARLRRRRIQHPGQCHYAGRSRGREREENCNAGNARGVGGHASAPAACLTQGHCARGDLLILRG